MDILDRGEFKKAMRMLFFGFVIEAITIVLNLTPIPPIIPSIILTFGILSQLCGFFDSGKHNKLYLVAGLFIVADFISLIVELLDFLLIKSSFVLFICLLVSIASGFLKVLFFAIGTLKHDSYTYKNNCLLLIFLTLISLLSFAIIIVFTGLSGINALSVFTIIFAVTRVLYLGLSIFISFKLMEEI